mgnify:CR=1 FL=1
MLDKFTALQAFLHNGGNIQKTDTPAEKPLDSDLIRCI